MNRARSWMILVAVSSIYFSAGHRKACGQQEIAPQESTTPLATTDPLDGFPAQREVGYVSFRDPSTTHELVSVGIYPESPQSPVRRPGTYYHRPVFAFKENAAPIEGYPPIVLSEFPQQDGSVVLDFRVKLTFDGLQSAGRAVVLSEDRQTALKDAGREELVKVNPWPLQGDIIVVCRNRATDEVLATKSKPISKRTELDVPLRFSAKGLGEFKILANSGQVVMDFYYHYRSINTAKGTLEISGSKNISIAVRDAISSRSGTPISDGDLAGKPVFQDERNRIERLVQARVERVINAEHPDIVPILQTQMPLLVDRLLASEDDKALDYDVLTTKFNRTEFDLQLASYLKPQIVRLNSTRTESDTHIDIREDEQSKIKAGGSGFTLFFIGFGQSSEEERERALRRVEDATGVTFGETKDQSLFRPHKIKSWRVREGWDQVEFNEKTIVFLPIGKETQYLVTSGVPTSFTESVAAAAMQAAKKYDVHNGVPLGTVMMWWGDVAKIPPGWEICDGGVIKTKGAVISGRKPNLVNRFPKGAVAGRNGISEMLSKGVGGSNDMRALRIDTLSGLTLSLAGGHQHDAREGFNGVTRSTGGDTIKEKTDNTAGELDVRNVRAMPIAGEHIHRLSGYVGKSDAVRADGNDKTGANQPAFSEVFFIIRVK